MQRCDSYHLQPKIKYTYNPLTGLPIAHDVKVGICWGTKECDECSCGGDMRQCDFYSDVRKRGRENVKIQDAIDHFQYGISHDIYSEPVTSYAKLAVKALKRQLKEERKQNG